jgi:hypothetical protein
MDEELDELYALPLGRFTEARNELSARLRDEGLRNDAKKVKALPKPSITAWTANQLVRRHRGEVERLLDAGATLRDAQQRVLGGAPPDELRSASARRREALAALRGPIGDILQDGGSSPTATNLERVTNTLMAASTDEGAAQQLRAGRLVKDLAPTGLDAPFGTDFGAALDAQRAAEGADEGRSELADEAEKASREADEAEAQAAEADRRADEAEQAAKRARAEAGRAHRIAEEARHKAERALDRVAGKL